MSAKPNRMTRVWFLLGILFGIWLPSVAFHLPRAVPQLRYCTLTEHGDWAVRSRDGVVTLYLAPRPYDVPNESLWCQVHDESKIEVISIPVSMPKSGV